MTIRNGRLYWPGRPYEAPAPAASGSSSRLENFRNALLLGIVWLYLLFNWSFQQVRIPPVAGGGVPVGEVVLFFALATMSLGAVLGKLSRTVVLVPFAVWWTFGIGRAVFDFMIYGTWALRDAVHVLESLYLIAGFAFAGDPKWFDRFFDWLPRLLVVGVIYALLYPVQDVVWAFSPTITTVHGFQAPLLGSMLTSAYLAILGAFYLILFHGNRLSANLIAVVLIGFVVAFFQARTLYLVLIALFGYLVLFRRSSIGNVGFIGYVSVLLLGLVSLIGLQLEGRLGASFNAQFLFAHFMAIFGICDPGNPAQMMVCAAAEGVPQRLEWWNRIFDQLLANPFNMLLGLGYGVVLTDFYGNSGTAVREPHNSYVTILARTGVIGIVAWVTMMLLLARRWLWTLRRCQALGWRTGENQVMFLMVFFIILWVFSLGEDGFEKPYNIIPFYFFWGVLLRFSLLLERGEIGPPAGRADH